MIRARSLFLSSIALTHLAVQAQQFAAIPADNQVYLGVWPDLSSGYSDTPAAVNARLGLNVPIFQIGQSIPLPPYDYTSGGGGEALFSSAADTATNCAFMLTVYPDQTNNLAAVQDSDLVQLANQIAAYENSGRTTYLRFAPEMGGIWNVYGLQPTLFKSLWIRMYTIVKQIAPQTIILWSPNTSYGYPSGATLDNVVSQEDKEALDTNHDGQLTSADDAFSPYYPGDQWVDWAGVSLYYKGPGFQNLNEPQPGGYCANNLLGFDPFYLVNYTAFYDTYCGIPNRPCMLSEAGAAYHTQVQGGATQLEMQQAWWEDCLTNTTFFDLFPNIKAIMMFEHAKVEYDGGVEDDRDYRILNTSDTTIAFREAILALGDRLVWANSTINGGESAVAGIVTSVPPIPSVSASALLTTTIPALGNEAVTYTSTGYSTPFYNGQQLSATQPGLTISGVVNAVQQSSAYPKALPASLASSMFVALCSMALVLYRQ